MGTSASLTLANCDRLFVTFRCAGSLDRIFSYLSHSIVNFIQTFIFLLVTMYDRNYRLVVWAWKPFNREGIIYVSLS